MKALIQNISAKMNEKNTILTPFSIIDKLTSPYAFSRTNRDSLNEKVELYFHDFSFVPLFMQVSTAQSLSGKSWLIGTPGALLENSADPHQQ